jgi:hypothetical protein
MTDVPINVPEPIKIAPTQDFCSFCGKAISKKGKAMHELYCKANPDKSERLTINIPRATIESKPTIDVPEVIVNVPPEPVKEPDIIETEPVEQDNETQDNSGLKWFIVLIGIVAVILILIHQSGITIMDKIFNRKEPAIQVQQDNYGHQGFL